MCLDVEICQRCFSTREEKGGRYLLLGIGIRVGVFGCLARGDINGVLRLDGALLKYFQLIFCHVSDCEIAEGCSVLNGNKDIVIL